jgi:hypothetical protein
VVGEKRRFEVETSGEPSGGTPWLQQMVSDAHVVALERVKVPAGEFDAYRVEHEGSTRNIGSYGYGTFRLTVWYVPDLHTWVALEYRTVWNGKPDVNQREELTSYALAASR